MSDPTFRTIIEPFRIKSVEPLRLTSQAETLSLEVRDDGRGRSGRDEEHGENAEHGTGLRGMSERLAAVGGDLHIIPGPARGFAVIASVPNVPDRRRAPVTALP